MNNLKAEQKLLTHAWIDDVSAVMVAIRNFAKRRTLQTSCRVVFFELAGDRTLHVNVIHAKGTTAPAGWSGPGVTADGFVHNRRFHREDPSAIARHIQGMMYAPPRRAAVLERSVRL